MSSLHTAAYRSDSLPHMPAQHHSGATGTAQDPTELGTSAGRPLPKRLRPVDCESEKAG